jgi:gamma-glutamylcyclotransferase (GGCT)/AIG2-like uncharacterized protein YtfP
MEYADAEFLGDCETKAKMRLCVDGLPYLIKGEHEDGENVKIELYSVDDVGLKILDSLEGHPYFYEREKIPLIMEDGSEIEAFVYQVTQKYDNGRYQKEY